MDLLTHKAYDQLLGAVCEAWYKVVTVRSILKWNEKHLCWCCAMIQSEIYHAL